MITETDIALRVIGAAILGGIVGYDRERKDKPAGIKTHLLVAAGSALFVGTTVLLTQETEVFGGDAAKIDVSRVMAGVVTGVGFLGAGAIITRRQSVIGLTTAAGIWVVAAIGSTVAFGFWLLAIVSTILALLVHGASWIHEIRASRANKREA